MVTRGARGWSSAAADIPAVMTGEADAESPVYGEQKPTAWLTIRRTSPEDVKERELYASLDGRRIAILLFGDVATISIAPGHHELRVHNTLSRKKAAFDAAPGQHVRFSAANVPGKGYGYWAFFVGAALMWTALQREEDGRPPAGPVAVSFRV
jgi:hypothetical protein